jgi:hypothetical protein
MRRSALLLLPVLFLGACATVPREASHLSGELGSRIEALEQAHMTLLRLYFQERRERIAQFVEEEWMPAFVDEVFADPRVATVGAEVFADGSAEDRLRFMQTVGARIQSTIAEKRRVLMAPIDELEAAVGERLRAEYAQARWANTQLTTLLSSATALDEQRGRFLGAFAQNDLGGPLLRAAGSSVERLIGAGAGLADHATRAEAFLGEMKDLIEQVDGG